MVSILLKTASGVMLLHTVGHCFGIFGWKKTDDPQKTEVIKMMTGPKFPFMGASRSMGDFYEGFGHAATISLILVAAVFWLVSMHTDFAGLSVPLLWAASVYCLLLGLLELRYFFLFAASFSLLAAALGFAAIFQL